MKYVTQIFRNFFHEQKSTLNGIMLLVLLVLINRFAGFSGEVNATIGVALVAAALKFLTGIDNSPSTTPMPTVDAKEEGLPKPPNTGDPL